MASGGGFSRPFGSPNPLVAKPAGSPVAAPKPGVVGSPVAAPKPGVVGSLQISAQKEIVVLYILILQETEVSQR